MEFIIGKTFEFMLLYVKKLAAKVVFIVKSNILFKLWYGWEPAYFQDVTRPVIIEDGTLHADRYIEEVLLIALEDDKVLLGNDFTYQQDGASSHGDEKNIIMVRK